ncbi:MAG: hypothetical protein ACE5GC_06925 [Acidimicrobiia bacterium]
MKRPLVAVAVLSVLAVACGGGGEGGEEVASLTGTVESVGAADDTVASLGDAPSEADGATDEEALLGFVACMREAGVDLEDPTVDAEGNLRIGGLRGRGPGANQGDIDRDAIRAGFEGCRELLEGAALGFGAQDRTELADQLLVFAACMRDNGFDMPDPDLTFTPDPGRGGGPFGIVDRDDPAFQPALEACGDNLPGVGRFGGRRSPGDGS